MWTGGKPPRIPTVAGSSSSKSPTSVMSKQRNAELEALKQRGLAKILNKHFTETTSRLAQEKAAADAAVADLQARKAHTSEFKETHGNGELSPLDAMYLRANQWRQECRRKERETLLLYQRYVHKFGDTGAVAIKQQQQHSWVPKATPDTAKTAAPPLLKSMPKSAVLANATQVPGMAAQIETTLEEYLKQGGMAKPSVQVLGKDETFQSAAAREEAEFRAFYRRQLEEKGVDAKASEKFVTEREPYDYSNKQAYGTSHANTEVDIFQRQVHGEWIDSAVASAEANLPCHTILEEDADDRSVVSGLTTLHSAMTREVLHDCEQSVADFLKEEQENIRKIMQDDAENETESFTSGTIEVDLANKATEEAESMVKKMEAILNEYQAKHGDDLKSVDGGASASGGGKKSHEPRHFPTDNPEEHWMVYYDEFYQQEYYHEKNSNRTQWEPPAVSVSSVSSSGAASVFSHVEVMPDQQQYSGGGGIYESRIAMYRRKRRRARRRKLFLAVCSVFVVAMAGYVATLPPEQRNVASITESVQQLLEQQYNQWTGKGKAIVLLEEQEEQRRLRQEEALRHLAELAEAARKEAEEDRLRREEAERQKALLHRPWACNIPFSYLFHSRCRRLANQNPVFDLQGLVSSMLQ